MRRNLHFAMGSGLPSLSEAARQFAGRMGNDRPPTYADVVASPQMTSIAARAYKDLPSYSADAVPAFSAMREETKRQFDYLTDPKGLGINVEVTKHDPYSGPRQLMGDVFHDRRLQVLGTKETGSHPFFTDDENDMFRAVHDAFGHAATGRGFDRHGEEAAYQSHATMFSPLARRALATETRGQNSALIRSGEFQPQKIALLPAQLSDPNFRPIGRRSQMSQAILQARQFHNQAFSLPSD